MPVPPRAHRWILHLAEHSFRPESKVQNLPGGLTLNHCAAFHAESMYDHLQRQKKSSVRNPKGLQSINVADVGLFEYVLQTTTGGFNKRLKKAQKCF